MAQLSDVSRINPGEGCVGLSFRMHWVRGHWRGLHWVESHSRRNRLGKNGGDFTKRQKRRIVAGLIEKGFRKEDASSEYQSIWDETVKWIQDGKPDGSEAFPPGGKWIAEDLYEVNGLIYKLPDL